MTRALLAAALLLAAPLARALDVPYLTGRVVDEAGVLDDAAKGELTSMLKAYEAKTGRQIAVLTLPSLDGEPLEDFSLKVARTWKLGRKGKDDGILILLARDDHKARIEVGYGLEGDLPDAAAGRIMRDRMIPRFRSGDYAGGLKDGAAAVIGTLDGTYTAPEPPSGGRVVRQVRVGGGIGDGMGDNLLEKLMISAFVFGILGLFEFFGIMIPGQGWFLYFFLIPFWASFPMAIWGARVGAGLLIAHLVLFPILKLLFKGTKIAKALGAGGGSSSGWSSGGGGWSSGGGGGGFSGGGGSFGGGGSSGSW